jgi:3-deoxy-7-phosphoheptulonate synthase
MVAVLKPNATNEQIENLTAWLEGRGLSVHISKGEFHTILGLIGDTSKIDTELLEGLEMVESVKRISEPFKSANRKFHPDDSVVEICDGGSIKIGGPHFQIMAGPCSVESPEQILSIARSVQVSGASILRGGAFKPRTSPYVFLGLHADGIELLLEAK